jgi:hypothetical protein
MRRRLALLLAVLAPSAGLAQSAGSVVISPSAFGLADCTSTSTSVTLSWTSTVTPATGDIYRVFVSTNSSCPTTGTPTGGTQLPGGDISATSVTQGYPTSGTLTRSEFRTSAGAICTTDATLWVCVQHLASGGTTAKATATGSALLEVQPPSVPVSVTVTPGDSALFVSWANGTDSAVAAASYNVTAVGPSSTRTQNFTCLSCEHRVSGLTNGVTYSVTVTAVSAGGNESGPSTTAATGTPQPVSGFWEQYHDRGGVEPGGCGGGPAGLLSLLGVALALRGLRRRS